MESSNSDGSGNSNGDNYGNCSGSSQSQSDVDCDEGQINVDIISVSISYFLPLSLSLSLSLTLSLSLSLTATRRAIDLESHWTQEWPVLEYSDNEKVMDANVERILDLYPIPEDYNVPHDDEKVEVSKKKKTTVRRL